MKQVKRNKSKVWRKCYGKPFLARRACSIASMVVAAATASAQISAVSSSFMPAKAVKARKVLEVVRIVTATSEALSNSSSELNKGFVKK